MNGQGRPRERPGPEPPPGPNRGADPAAPGAPGGEFLAQHQGQAVEPRRFTRGQRALHDALELAQQQQKEELMAQQRAARDVPQTLQPEGERLQPPLDGADWPTPESTRQLGPTGRAGLQTGGPPVGTTSGGGRGSLGAGAKAARGGRGRGRIRPLPLDDTPEPVPQRPPCRNTVLCRRLRTAGAPCECDFQQQSAEGDGEAEMQPATHRTEEVAEGADAAALPRRLVVGGLPAESQLGAGTEVGLPEGLDDAGMDLDAPEGAGEGAPSGPAAEPAQFMELPLPAAKCPCCDTSLQPGLAFRAHAASAAAQGTGCAAACRAPYHPDAQAGGQRGPKRGTLGTPHSWRCVACTRTCSKPSMHRCRVRAVPAAATSAGRGRRDGAGTGLLPAAAGGGGTPSGSLHPGGPAARVGPTAACWGWVDGKLDGAEGLAALTVPSQLAFQRSFNRGQRRLRQFLACVRVVVEKLVAATATGDERGCEAAFWLCLALPRMVLRLGVGGRGGAGSRGRMGGPSDGRFVRFLNGDWEELWAEAVTAEAAAASKRAEGQRRRAEQTATDGGGGAAQERRIRRAMRQAAERQYGTALRTLTATAGIRPATPEVRASLQDKHPASGELSAAERVRFGSFAERIVASYGSGAAAPPVAGALPPLPQHQLVLSLAALRRALVTAPRGSSGGGSGWLLDILRCMGLDGGDEGLGLVHALVAPIAQGRLPPRVADALGACTLLAVPKGAADVRPIACGESLHRIAFRAICIQFGNAWCEHLCPMQYSVRARDGAAQLSWALRSLVEKALAEGEDFQVVKFDIRNAFNEVKRAAVLGQLQEHFPELLPGICSFYLRPGVLHCRGPDGVVYQLLSRGGVRQGDPIAPFLFALALHPILRRVQAEYGKDDVYVMAFADDGKLAGPPDATYGAFLRVEELLPGVGLSLSDGVDKNVAWSTGAFSQDLLDREAPVKAAAAAAKAAAKVAEAAAAAAERAPARPAAAVE